MARLTIVPFIINTNTLDMDKNLEQELSKWIEQEQKYAKLFSTSVLKSKAFKKERLKELIAIEAKYSRRNLQDPALLTFLKVEKRQLEHEISPRVFSFLFRKLMDAVRLVVYRRRNRNLMANDSYNLVGTSIQTRYNTNVNTFREVVSHQQASVMKETPVEVTRQSVGGITNANNGYGAELVPKETEKVSASSDLSLDRRTGALDKVNQQKKVQAPRKRMKISR